MGAKALINAHPKNVLGSKGARRCRVCGTKLLLDFTMIFLLSVSVKPNLPMISSHYHPTANPSAIIRKYHLDMCRQCFRERALDIGFVKVRFTSRNDTDINMKLLY